jgi:hypothetical protein
MDAVAPDDLTGDLRPTRDPLGNPGGAGLSACWSDLWPLLVLAAVMIPAGLAVFRAGEWCATRHGKLKRSADASADGGQSGRLRPQLAGVAVTTDLTRRARCHRLDSECGSDFI